MFSSYSIEFCSGDSYRIQTYNLLIRSQMLYSVELRSRVPEKSGGYNYSSSFAPREASLMRAFLPERLRR